MKAWLMAIFIVPFSPKAYWEKSGLNSETASNWDHVLALLFVSFGGFLGMHFILFAIDDSMLEKVDIPIWLIVFYVTQVLRLALIASMFKGSTKVKDVPLLFSRRLSVLLVCSAIPMFCEILLSHLTKFIFVTYLIRAAFLVWTYILLYHAFNHFTNKKGRNIGLGVALISVFDAIVAAGAMFILSLIMYALLME